MILAQEKEYKGPLGEFRYNTADFEVMNKYTPIGVIQILKYRGQEVDGSKIKIPLGVKDCSYMFEKQSIKTPPVIPPTVRCTNYMFYGCVSLERGALLPYGVESASFMYAGCRNVMYVPACPGTLRLAQYMCDGCRSLLAPPVLNNGIQKVTGLCRNCIGLQELALLPDTVIDASYMYRGTKGVEAMRRAADDKATCVKNS